ncbi:hypothetical protein E9229_001489 [Paeniglutamicibacter cryotolerans]|uniref:Uncharacterized protein n=1 Tax=Paeniglutamicibacter cryotolerans TaxID=670079 RepID=A0A839QG55_9MICC|nr:hypothetical protein [Paeniglutamicibacter cryotolerans]MBB2995298.1 hypothetical protein [Paeniglutamicibacter cryotolerans]
MSRFRGTPAYPAMRCPGSDRGLPFFLQEERGTQESQKNERTGRKERVPDTEYFTDKTAGQRSDDMTGHDRRGEDTQHGCRVALGRLSRNQDRGSRGVPCQQPGQKAQGNQLFDVPGHADERHRDCHA